MLFTLDAATARNLELILNARNFGSDHCLYGVMNHTKTAAGGKVVNFTRTTTITVKALFHRIAP